MDSNSVHQLKTYKVVLSDEELYSVWPVDYENPLGWKNVGVTGSMEKCLDYIREVWTDMRPLSLRNKEIASKGS